MISRAERYTIVTGKGYRPRQQDLGKWKYPALACALLFLFVAVVVPFLVFLYTSFLPYLQAPCWNPLKVMTLKDYRLLSHYEKVGSALHNSVVKVTVTAPATAELSVLVSD